MILVFWMLSFKPTFSLFSLTFIKRHWKLINYHTFVPLWLCGGAEVQNQAKNMFVFSFLIWLSVDLFSEKAMAPHSSTLAWKIPWTEEPGRPQSMGSLRVGHDWATSLSLFSFMHWRGKWQPTPVFLPGESRGQGSLVVFRLWASVYGIAQSRTRLKRHSSSSSSRLVLCVSDVGFHSKLFLVLRLGKCIVIF